MIQIPRSFLDENESYLVIPVLRRFCSKYNLRQFNVREELLDEILDFANMNDNNRIIFLNWLEESLKEGNKHIYIRDIFSNNEQFDELKNLETCEEILATIYEDCPNNYISEATHEIEIKLQNYRIHHRDNIVHKLSFNFTIKLLCGDSIMDVGRYIIFPVFIDVDIENNYISGRAKPKTNLFKKTDPTNDTLIQNLKVSNKELIIEAIKKIKNDLDLEFRDNYESHTIFRNKLFNLLKYYTFTPDEIQCKINSMTNKIDNFINDVFSELEIPLLSNFDNAKEDLNIFIEKFISINYDDQTIFTKDRDAYPVRLSATDSELTKISEASANREPLQHKEKYFDNKKSIERDESCDGMMLCFNRNNTKYFGNNPFVVSLEVIQGYLSLKFPQYVEEEDIQHVLSRAIEDSE
ncbi:hypothetical protein [Tissierella sp.]|uniref:hypothetical protein n=1 Tax=Tissierella sp. TaxID=41274 RepID=UPI00286220AD|nr:hypothetical protein [Tissierella sp.]MDR7856347.1 hypothetical protein [Tissierella sp.]